MRKKNVKTPKHAHRHPLRPERMDIYAVAKVARVSSATVSRTINHVPTVNPKLAARVWEAVRKLNYFPNTQARALVSGRSRMLGLIVAEITNPFFPELIQGFEEVAIEHGYEILIGSASQDPERMKRCIHRMIERKADGIAIMTFGIEQRVLDQLASQNIPLVMVDEGPERSGVSVLRIDYHEGIRQSVQHLAALGHRTIGFVTGPPRQHSSQARLDAFKKAAQACGIPDEPRSIVESDHTMEGGITAAGSLIAAGDLPTAIVCSNDMLAIGVLHRLSRERLRVPDDISLIGFDDIRMAEMMIPPLTSVRMSRMELARTAVAALCAHAESRDPQREYRIGTQLLVRESTGFPRGSPLQMREYRIRAGTAARR
jgi:DNA-binding LacI/PurR family transcriptional regulator